MHISLLLKFRRIIVVFINLAVIILAYFISFYLRFEFNIPREGFLIFFNTIALLAMLKMIIFYYFDVYSGLWRFVSMDDLSRIIRANIISAIIFAIVILFIFKISNFPRSIFILDTLICIGFMTGLRFVSRYFKESILLPSYKRRAIIIGAGDAGILVLKESKKLNLDILGFIDDSELKKNKRIYGVKVLGDRKDIANIVKNYNIDEIIIAMPSAPGEVIRELITCCSVSGVEFKIMPNLDKIISGDLDVSPREVMPEDLLGRKIAKVDEVGISSYIKDKRILVTGAAGSIGSELSRQIVSYSPSHIVLLDRNENHLYFLEVELKTKYPDLKIITVIGDITDELLLRYLFSTHNPQLVFHSAAYKHVPLMEDNPTAAVENNILGTQAMINISDEFNVERFIFISSDKALKPISIMGCSKRIGEMILQVKAQSSKTKFISVRFGNVIGSSGSAVLLFKKQILNGGPITVTHPDSTRYFMSVREAVQLVLEAVTIGKNGEIFVLDMGKPIKIVDLVRNLVSLSGFELNKDIFIRYTGLRPGEKIVEENLIDRNTATQTKHQKIFTVLAAEFDFDTFIAQLGELNKIIVQPPSEENKNALKRAIYNITKD